MDARPRQLSRIPSEDETFNRFQDQLIATLNPFLGSSDRTLTPLDMEYSAGTNLLAAERCAVKLGASGQVEKAGAGQAAIGVLVKGGRQGERVTVRLRGLTQARIGSAAVAGGTVLAADLNGSLTTAYGNDKPVAVAAEGADAQATDAWVVVQPSLAPVGPVFSETFVIPALSTVADTDILARLTIQTAGRLYSSEFYVTTAVTTAARGATITPYIGGVSVTGGAVVLTSANCTPKGARVAGTAITTANTFTAGQEITLVASGVTAFAEGAGVVVLNFR